MRCGDSSSGSVETGKTYLLQQLGQTPIHHHLHHHLRLSVVVQLQAQSARPEGSTAKFLSAHPRSSVLPLGQRPPLNHSRQYCRRFRTETEVQAMNQNWLGRYGPRRQLRCARAERFQRMR